MATALAVEQLESKMQRALSGECGYVALTREEEAELARRHRAGDRQCGWALAMANQNFVRSIAQRYLREDLETEDLVAEGLLGLIDAVERFDGERGIKFITYGIWWVKRSILRYLRQVGHAVHVPKYKEHEVLELRRAQARLAQELGRTPTLEELSAATGADPEEVQEGLALALRAETLASVPEDGDLDVVDPAPGAEESLIHANRLERLGRCVPELEPRERAVVERRFGLGGRDTATLAELGREMGLTKERVRQIELGVCERLRDGIDGAKMAPRRSRRSGRNAAPAPFAA